MRKLKKGKTKYLVNTSYFDLFLVIMSYFDIYLEITSYFDIYLVIPNYCPRVLSYLFGYY